MGRRQKSNEVGLVISREIYDSWQRRVGIALGADPAEVQDLVDRSYPKSSQEALLETQARGLRGSEYLLAAYAKRNRLPQVAGCTIWSRAAVDDLVADLCDRGYFSKQSIAAATLGKTERDFLELVSSLAFANDLPVEPVYSHGGTHERTTDVDP